MLQTTLHNIINGVKNRLRVSFSYKEMLTFSLFVIYATLLWYTHALNSERYRTISVALSFTGIPDNISLSQPLPDHITNRLHDQGHRLIGYDEVFAKPLNIDLTEQIKGKEGTLIVSSEQLRPKINDLLQGTTKLQEITPEIIERHYFREAQKTVRVVFNGTIEPAKQYLMQTYNIQPENITIYGRSSALDTIREIPTLYTDLRNIKDTMLFTLPLNLPDSIRCQPGQVQLTAIADQFTERVFVLPIRTKHMPANRTIRLFPETVEVRTIIDMKHYADISENELEAYCNFPDNPQTKNLEITVKTNNPYIKIIRFNPQNIEYIVEKK